MTRRVAPGMPGRPGPQALEFLASGGSQHVFCDPASPGVVWKLPAVHEELLPSPPGLSTFAPTIPYKVALWRHLRPVLEVRWLHGPGDQCLRRYLRFRRTQAFRTMLQTVRRVHVMAGDDLLLPCQITRLDGASLATPIGTRRYTGPALLQARADRFMTWNLDFDFDWGAPIRIQRALWCCGVGLADADSVLGPHNWAVLGERVLLGDTGSLTRDRRTALAVMDERPLREVAKRLVSSAARCGMEAVAKDYIRALREGLGKPSLIDLWNTGTSSDRTLSEASAAGERVAPR